MDYITYLKNQTSKISFFEDLRFNVFSSHLWLIHIIQKSPNQKNNLLNKFFKILKELDINSLVSTTLVIDHDVKCKIEKAYKLIANEQINWMNPISNVTDKINFVLDFDNYYNSTLEKELFYIVSLIINFKEYTPYEEDDIQFVKNIIDIQKNIVDINDPLNCFEYTKLLMLDAKLSTGYNKEDEDEVSSIDEKVSLLLGNGFNLAISKINKFKTMKWGGTIKTIKSNLASNRSK